MHEPWTTVFSVSSVALALLAGLNLLRIFVGDWLEGRREERPASLRVAPSAAATQPVYERPRPVRRALAACLVAPSLIVAAAHAQDSTAPDPNPAASEGQQQLGADQSQASANDRARSAEETKSPFSLQLNLDYTTAYFYRGIIQEDTGLILQPAAKLTVNLSEQGDFKIDGLLGAWNSLHGQKTGANTRGDFTEYWYEADLFGGFVLSKDKISLTATCTFLTSPGDAYETVQELGFTLAYDDSDLLEKFALHPYALISTETGADASDGADSDTGKYLEPGIAPGFSFDAGKTPIAITFPVSVGLSLDDYYRDAAGDDDTSGFALAGVKASVPLPFGDRHGAWTLNAGVSALFLGDHTADFNGADEEQLIGTIGLQLNF